MSSSSPRPDVKERLLPESSTAVTIADDGGDDVVDEIHDRFDDSMVPGRPTSSSSLTTKKQRYPSGGSTSIDPPKLGVKFGPPPVIRTIDVSAPEQSPSVSTSNGSPPLLPRRSSDDPVFISVAPDKPDDVVVTDGENGDLSPAPSVNIRRFFSTGNLLSRLRAGGQRSPEVPSSGSTNRRFRYTSEGQPSAVGSQSGQSVHVKLGGDGNSSQRINLHNVTTVAGFDRFNHPLLDIHKVSNKKVRNYYRKQSDLLKNYQADQVAVSEFTKRKSLSKQSSSVAPTKNETKPIVDQETMELMLGGDEMEESDKDLAGKMKEKKLSGSGNGLLPMSSEKPLDATMKDLEGAGTMNRQASHGGTVQDRRSTVLAQISFAANVVLLIIKLVAVIMTGSYAIISSLVDSCVDLTSGFVIWMTNMAIEKRDPYLYPRGRTRLEPIALVIISVVMAVASIQVIVQSTEAAISGDFHPVVEWLPLSLMLLTIVIKFCLYLACRSHQSNPSVAVLAQDHRNDCVSNSVAVTCAVIGYYWWKYVDPIGAIAVSFYIIATWYATGYGQIKMLSGRTADAEFINRIIKISLEHDERIVCIDTVLVYHFGTKFLVEVHIVLDETMSIREAHDIQEPLQNKIECLDYVERAFVHVDYDTEHRPEDEHKIV